MKAKCASLITIVIARKVNPVQKFAFTKMVQGNAYNDGIDNVECSKYVTCDSEYPDNKNNL